MQAEEIPAEVREQLSVAENALRAEIREAVLFSPRPGGGQKIDRTGIVISRANDGGSTGYQQALSRIMEQVVGRQKLKEMRKARRAAARAGTPLVEPIPEDRPSWVDRDPDTIERHFNGRA